MGKKDGKKNKHDKDTAKADTPLIVEVKGPNENQMQDSISDELDSVAGSHEDSSEHENENKDSITEKDEQRLFFNNKILMLNLSDKNKDKIPEVVRQYGPRLRVTEWQHLVEKDFEELIKIDHMYSACCRFDEEEIMDKSLNEFRRFVQERINGFQFVNKEYSRISSKQEIDERRDSSQGSAAPTQLLTTTNRYPVLGGISKAAINSFELDYAAFATSTGRGVDRGRWSDNIIETISMLWLLHPTLSTQDWRDDRVISMKDLLRYLQERIRGKGEEQSSSPELNLLNSLANEKVLYDPFDPTKMSERMVELKVLLKRASDGRSNDNAALIKEGNKNLNMKVMDPQKAKMALETSIREAKVTSFVEWLNHVYVHALTKGKEFYNCIPFGPPNSSSSRNNSRDNKRSAEQISQTSSAQAKSSNKSNNEGPVSDCITCGRRHGGTCAFTSVAWANHSTASWANSVQGKKFKALGYNSLPRTADPPQRDPSQQKDKKTGYQGKYNSFCYLSSAPISTNTFFANLHDREGQVLKEEVEILVDQGADTDYISRRLADLLILKKQATIKTNKIVCSGFSNDCNPSNYDIIILLNFYDTYDKRHSLEIKTSVIDTDYNIVIGRPTIIMYNFVLLFPSFFMSKELEATLLPSATGRGEMPKVVDQKRRRAEELDTQKLSCNCLTSMQVQGKVTRTVHEATHASEYATCKKKEYALHNTSDILPILNKNIEKETCNFALFRLMSLRATNKESTSSSNLSLRSAYDREDIAEINDDQLEAISSHIFENNNEESRTPTKIFGPESLQTKIGELLIKYTCIFSSTVRSEPAAVEPFELQVDKTLWEVPANRLGARKMDKVKAYEIRKQIQKLEEIGVIRPSEQGHYSHGFVVPKTDNKWRLVIDFKNLNKISQSENWPIPNIKQLLYRIGDQRPKYFAVMDLTAGYHQIPLHANTSKWTAFMTFWGVYEWLRLPMGLKGAGSFFQRVMSTVILAGLVMTILELYLDDVIVHSKTEEEFLERLEIVFQRFKRHGITLNPEKCSFGMSEVVYVGHTLNEQGIHFTRSKLDSVKNFPRPTTERQLRSFLGLANWFRDHINDHSNKARPLQQMLVAYKQRRKLIWTAAADEAFERIKQDIDECPMLFFLDDVSPIYLYTDASNYGIGAYLFQLVDGIRKPIGFISQSFCDRMLNWDTPQKEGYAIYYALQKWEYLLRDRKFNIKTDHANLTRLKNDYGSNKKVQRWLLCFQSFDFEIEAIAGDTNTVADALSRLCTNNEEVASTRLNVLTTFNVPQQHWIVIGTVHNSITGHGGVERTLAKLRAAHKVWDHQREHIRHFISLCPCCQKMNQLKHPIHAHPFTTSTYKVMERITMDVIESLQPDEEGNTCIHVIIDSFSRFIELIPSKDNTAKAAARALLSHIGRYGAPHQIGSDNGRNYVSDMIKELVIFIGSEQLFTMEYSKEESAIVERSNKEVLRHLRNIIFDKNVIESHSTYLPLVQRIMNSSIHESLGVSPAQILFGNSINLDRGIFLDHVEGIPEERLSIWMAKMLKAQATIMEVARRNLQAKDNVHMLTYPTARDVYEINSYVLVEYRNSTLRRGPRSKLLPFLKGPLRVTGSTGSKYLLQDLVTMRISPYHVSKIRQFRFDPTTQDPLLYALKDDGHVYAIDKISAMKGNPRASKKQLTFQVHWKGYEQATWEPWEHLRRSKALHEYLKQHKTKAVRDLVPKNYISETPNHDSNDEHDSDSGYEE